MADSTFPLPGRYFHEGQLLFGAIPRDHLEALKHFQLQDGGVIVAGYPKTGNTDFILNTILHVDL